jgi:hypothetical protein
VGWCTTSESPKHGQRMPWQQAHIILLHAPSPYGGSFKQNPAPPLPAYIDLVVGVEQLAARHLLQFLQWPAWGGGGR